MCDTTKRENRLLLFNEKNETSSKKEGAFGGGTAELFSNFTGVYPLMDMREKPSDLYRISLIKRALEFIDVIEEHFEGTSLNNTAEEIADHYIATAD